jgi:hypothetical protein
VRGSTGRPGRRKRLAAAAITVFVVILEGLVWAGSSSGSQLRREAASEVIIGTWNLCNHACDEFSEDHIGIDRSIGSFAERVPLMRDRIRSSHVSVAALQETNYVDAGRLASALGPSWRHSEGGLEDGRPVANVEMIWDSAVWSADDELGQALPSGMFRNATDDEAYEPDFVNMDGSRGRHRAKTRTTYQELRLRENGRRYLFVDAHLFYGDQLPDGRRVDQSAFRMLQARRIISSAKHLGTADAELLVMGDMNTKAGEPGVTPLSAFEAAGLHDNWSEGRNLKPGLSSYNAGGTWRVNLPIDHAFLPESMAVEVSDMVNVPEASDHNLVTIRVRVSPPPSDRAAEPPALIRAGPAPQRPVG